MSEWKNLILVERKYYMWKKGNREADIIYWICCRINLLRMVTRNKDLIIFPPQPGSIYYLCINNLLLIAISTNIEQSLKI
jgi:hypothetical protein